MFVEPEQWTQIQAPLKFYKLIVDELSNLYRNTTDDVEECSDEVSDLIRDTHIIPKNLPIILFLCFPIYLVSGV